MQLKILCVAASVIVADRVNDSSGQAGSHSFQFGTCKRSVPVVTFM